MADGVKTCMTPATVQIVAQNDSVSAGVDDVSATLQVIDFPHHEIHEGDSFVSDHEATLASAGTIVLSFKTSDTAKWAHMVFMARASGEANILIIENPTITAGTGTLHPVYNRNRNSATVTTLSDSSTGSFVAGNITLGATQSGGTVIYDEHFGSGQKVGGSSVGRDEFILKQNTNYTIILTSEAAANDCETILDWYEHTSVA